MIGGTLLIRRGYKQALKGQAVPCSSAETRRRPWGGKNRWKMWAQVAMPPRCHHNLETAAEMTTSKWINQVGPDTTTTPKIQPS